MYEIIVILKALTEVAGVAMIGQGVLWVLAGAKRDENLIYGIFKTLTSPVMRATRWITPRIVLDQHMGLAAFFLLGGVRGHGGFTWMILLLGFLAAGVYNLKACEHQAGRLEEG